MLPRWLAACACLTVDEALDDHVHDLIVPIVFPNMTNWLPADERDRMRAEWAAEMARLG